MKVLFIIVIMLFIGNSYLFSQEPTTCESCDDWHGPIVQTFDLSEELNCKTSITYSWQECNGVWEFRYVDIATSGNCEFMSDFSIYHHNVNAMYELLDLLLLQRFATSTQGFPPFDYVVPDCSTSTTNTITKVYSASCGVWVKCTYEVDPDSKECEQGFDEPPPHYGVGPYYVDYWRWQTCGEVCCEKIYTVCASTHPITSNRTVEIQLQEKNKIGECTEDPAGSSPKYDKPCLDGCSD